MYIVKAVRDKLHLSFPYQKEIMSEIRRVVGSKWCDGYWEITLSDNNKEQVFNLIDKWGFKYSSELLQPSSSIQSISIDIQVKKNNLCLTFPYNQQVIEDVKQIEGRVWSGKNWNIPVGISNYSKVLSFLNKYKIDIKSNPSLSSLLQNIKKDIDRQEVNLIKSSSTVSYIEVEGLKLPLRDFQKAGIEYIVNNRQVLLGDEMGLGKTVQAIASIHSLQAYPCLVVCPNSLKYNWQNEYEKWLGMESQVINSGSDSIKNGEKVYIISYNLLSKFEKQIDKLKLKAIVGDESHYLKNKTASRTRTFSKIAKKIDIRLLLTGTPINNRPSELISQLEILDKFQSVFGGWFPFVKRYCDAQRTRYGWDVQGSSNLEELHSKLRQSCYIRRDKSTVLAELPDKTRVRLDMDIDNVLEYTKAEYDIMEYFKEFNFSQQQIDAATRAKHLVQLNLLKKLSIKGKLSTITTWVQEFLESGEKLVLFGVHTDIINYISDKFKCNKITGEVSAENRQKYVDDFQQNPETKLIVMNIQAGGVGITLTKASNVAFMELPWTPGELLQAEDRCHRLGQKSAVTCYYLIGKETIDIDIYNLLQDKMLVTNAVNAGVFTESRGLNMMRSLIKNLTDE